MKEWEHEPNRLEADYKGMKLLIVRNESLGNLCGYVGIAKEHPLYGKDYDDFPDLDVHGGVTFSEEGDGKRWFKGYWWVGFDCAHGFDYVPFMEERTRKLMGTKYKRISNAVYRNICYVLSEAIRLADQLLEIKT